jgi:hypothetical protein
MEIIMTDKKKTKKKSPSERDIVEEVSKIADKMRMSFDEVGKNEELSDKELVAYNDIFSLFMNATNAFINVAIHQFCDKDDVDVRTETILHMLLGCLVVHTFARSPDRDCAYTLLADVVGKFETLEKTTQDFIEDGNLEPVSEQTFKEHMSERQDEFERMFETDEDSVPSDAVIH